MGLPMRVEKPVRDLPRKSIEEVLGTVLGIVVLALMFIGVVRAIWEVWTWR